MYWRPLRLETTTNMGKHTILSIGCNRKLAKDIGILNLPEGVTCPGATQLCKAVCYARKSGRMYKTARDKRQANLLLSQQKGFGDALAAEIKALELGRIRLHEAGDVYNQAYLDELVHAADVLPWVVFLMYTKSFHLDWSKLPSNVVRYWSVDKTTTMRVPPGLRAYLVAKGDQPPVPPRPQGKPALTCNHVAAKHYCGSECRICWDAAADVYFEQH